MSECKDCCNDYPLIFKCPCGVIMEYVMVSLHAFDEVASTGEECNCVA